MSPYPHGIEPLKASHVYDGLWRTRPRVYRCSKRLHLHSYRRLKSSADGAQIRSNSAFLRLAIRS